MNLLEAVNMRQGGVISDLEYREGEVYHSPKPLTSSKVTVPVVQHTNDVAAETPDLPEMLDIAESRKVLATTYDDNHFIALLARMSNAVTYMQDHFYDAEGAEQADHLRILAQDFWLAAAAYSIDRKMKA